MKQTHRTREVIKRIPAMALTIATMIVQNEFEVRRASIGPSTRVSHRDPVKFEKHRHVVVSCVLQEPVSKIWHTSQRGTPFVKSTESVEEISIRLIFDAHQTQNSPDLSLLKRIRMVILEPTAIKALSLNIALMISKRSVSLSGMDSATNSSRYPARLARLESGKILQIIVITAYSPGLFCRYTRIRTSRIQSGSDDSS